MVVTCGQLQAFTRVQHWQLGQQAPNWPSFSSVQSQLQQFVQSVWLQLGPALLAMCRRSCGEAGEEGEEVPRCVVNAMDGTPLGAASSKQVYATFSELLMNINVLQGGWADKWWHARLLVPGLVFHIADVMSWCVEFVHGRQQPPPVMGAGSTTVGWNKGF
jgi:hypothetical protein